MSRSVNCSKFIRNLIDKITESAEIFLLNLFDLKNTIYGPKRGIRAGQGGTNVD